MTFQNPQRLHHLSQISQGGEVGEKLWNISFDSSFIYLSFYISLCVPLFYLPLFVVFTWNFIEWNYKIKISSSFCYIRQIWGKSFCQITFLLVYITPQKHFVHLQENKSIYETLWKECSFCFSGKWSSIPTPDSDHRGIWTGCFQVFTF